MKSTKSKASHPKPSRAGKTLGSRKGDYSNRTKTTPVPGKAIKSNPRPPKK